MSFARILAQASELCFERNTISSGEMASPKRAFAKLPRPSIAVSPKREPAAWARALPSLEWRPLAWARPAAGHTVFLYLVVMDCLMYGSTLFKVWGLWNAWKFVVIELNEWFWYELGMRFKWDSWYQRDMVMIWKYKSLFVLREGWVGIDLLGIGLPSYVEKRPKTWEAHVSLNLVERGL